MSKLYHHLSAPRRSSLSKRIPRLWLMSDERIGDALMPAIKSLPRGSGVVFRHYSLSPSARRVLFDAVRVECIRQHHMLLLAGPPRLARLWRADGAHGYMRGCVSSPVHNMRERVAAERRGAEIMFVSPVFATRSHPGSRTLGKARFSRLSRGARAAVIALGGMNAPHAKSLRGSNIHGWAAIDGLMPFNRD